MTKEGYKQILLTEEVYEEVKKLKGKQSFSSFIKNLLDASSTDTSEVETEKEVSRVSIPTEEEKEHRYHGCRDCDVNEVQVENCRIRMERYELYGQKCPREIELIKSGG